MSDSVNGVIQTFRIVVDSLELSHLSETIKDCLIYVPNLPEREVIAYNIELAVHELCVNILQHAGIGQKPILLTITLLDDPLRLEVHSLDQGEKSFDEASWQPPDLDVPQEHGLGIWLIKSLMDDVRYRSSESFNYWRLVKMLPTCLPDCGPTFTPTSQERLDNKRKELQ